MRFAKSVAKAEIRQSRSPSNLAKLKKAQRLIIVPDAPTNANLTKRTDM